ncbi:hypothetical protein DPMN_046915 [Dreissena polymorpha]|uniref:Uncharacterized protein n=1 Tax=Dreissena polymorpha TaxID=45954 RepID=A0A9D4I2N7_DREPO|nr:hypothetical protein DPMN_046915 [Dreissena polymorpha]
MVIGIIASLVYRRARHKEASMRDVAVVRPFRSVEKRHGGGVEDKRQMVDDSCDDTQINLFTHILKVFF